MITLEVSGHTVLIDDDDIELFRAYKWRVSGKGAHVYLARGMVFDGKFRTILFHRAILGTVKGVCVDHINGNTLDNRRINLRECTHAQNMCNKKTPSHNTSGFKGVTYIPNRKNAYRAFIRVDRKTKSLGYYATPELAHEAYVAAAKDLHGVFFRAS